MTTLVCAGRPANRFDNTLSGLPCGARYDGEPEGARVAGWRVGPVAGDGTRPAMCPDCARPGAGSGDDSENVWAAALDPLPGL